MKQHFFKGIILFLLCNVTNAQDVPRQWTLEECIRYAVDNNVTLKQHEQEEELRSVELNTSRHSWLPNVNASLGQNLDFGRAESRDGLIVDRNSASTSFGVQMRMPVFNGFKIQNTIAVRELNLQAATESLNRAKEDLAIGVASYYLQALYNKEMLTVAELQVSLTTEQVARTEALVSAGRVPASQLYDVRAQLAKDEITLTEARNGVSLALLDLAQALELERLGADFDVVQPDTQDAVAANMGSFQSPDDIFVQASRVKPHIREQEYLLESRKMMLKVAQADYYPRLDLFATYGNGYYRDFGSKDMISVPFGDQWTQNERKTVGLSLNIPIFNRFEIRNNVRQARIGIIHQELMIESSKKALYKEIQQA
jgi:outer membrane protein